MAETNNAPEYSQKWWLSEIEAAEKWLDKQWRETADNVVARYLDRRDSGASTVDENAKKKYNIFWANVQIVKSALYATPPKPNVKRTHDDQSDDVARVASMILQRMLERDLNVDDGDMHQAFDMSVEDRLIPGLGQVWLRYEAETTAGPDGQPAKIDYECVHTEYVNWRDFIFPEIRVWADKTWVGRRVWTKKKAFVKRFGQDKYDELKESAQNASRSDPTKSSGFKKGKVEVFEIWCEETNKAYWIAKHATEILDEKPDLYKLDGFYPCPEPLLATHTNDEFIPRSDYTMAADQYDELDTLNDRISTLTAALRVVGIYDKNNAEIGKMLSGAELAMISVDNWAMFAENGGLKGQVDWFPIDVVAEVLERLMNQRIAVITQIYELTSISDIQRGASNPRETLGAQKLKAQYSSVRLQLIQQSVGKFIRRAMKLKCELICRQMEPDTIIKQSAIAYSESGKNQMMVQEAIALLKNFDSTRYRIEVGEETLSLADYNAERELRTQYLTAVGQFVSQASQVMEYAPQALPYILRMVQWVTAAFRGSSDIESVLDEAIASAGQQQPQKDDGKAAEQAAKVQMLQISEASKTQIAQAHEETALKIAELNNGTKIVLEEMSQKMEKMALENQNQMDMHMANMQSMQEKAQQASDMIQTLLTGYKEASMQDQQLQATAQEGEAQRGHERDQQQQELVAAMKELTGNLSKKRVRKPIFDGDGNITHIEDTMEKENASAT